MGKTNKGETMNTLPSHDTDDQPAQNLVSNLNPCSWLTYIDMKIWDAITRQELWAIPNTANSLEEYIDILLTALNSLEGQNHSQPSFVFNLQA
jgi:hypothetical protein